MGPDMVFNAPNEVTDFMLSDDTVRGKASR